MKRIKAIVNKIEEEIEDIYGENECRSYPLIIDEDNAVIEYSFIDNDEAALYYGFLSINIKTGKVIKHPLTQNYGNDKCYIVIDHPYCKKGIKAVADILKQHTSRRKIT